MNLKSSLLALLLAPALLAQSSEKTQETPAATKELVVEVTSRIMARKFSGAAAHLDPESNRILIFGAAENLYDGSQFKKWSFALDLEFLDKPNTDNPSLQTYKTKGSVKPSSRSYSSMAPFAKSLFMFGGFRPEFLGDLWQFSLETKAWTELKATSSESSPAVRDAHATFVDEKLGQFYVFGGLNKKGVRNDLWSWDISKGSWKELKTTDDPAAWPSPRLTHRMVAQEAQSFLLFGGQTSQFGPLNELWSFDSAKTTWKRLKDAPIGLAGPAIVWHPVLKNLIVIGGNNGGKAQDCILAYDPKSGSWANIGKLNQAVAHATAVYDPTKKHIVILGGTTGVFMGPHPKVMLQEIRIVSKPENPLVGYWASVQGGERGSWEFTADGKLRIGKGKWMNYTLTDKNSVIINMPGLKGSESYYTLADDKLTIFFDSKRKNRLSDFTRGRKKTK